MYAESDHFSPPAWQTTIISCLDYCSSLLTGYPCFYPDQESALNTAARGILCKWDHAMMLLRTFCCLPMSLRVKPDFLTMAYKALHNLFPPTPIPLSHHLLLPSLPLFTLLQLHILDSGCLVIPQLSGYGPSSRPFYLLFLLSFSQITARCSLSLSLQISVLLIYSFFFTMVHL